MQKANDNSIFHTNLLNCKYSMNNINENILAKIITYNVFDLI